MTTNNIINVSPALSTTGGTMTGIITLNADPVSGLQAATKEYTDASAGGLQIGAISNFWYPSGSILGGCPTSNASVARATGTLYFHPIFISKTTTFIKIGILLSTPAAGTSVLGLYNDSGSAKPTGSPIANSNSGSITNVVGAFLTFTFGAAITLTPGVYWTAHSTSGTTNFLENNVTIGGRGLGLNATPTTSNINTCVAGWSQSFVYSSTLPSVGSLTAQLNKTAGDMSLYLQAQ